jgi:argininosuccinate lyase
VAWCESNQVALDELTLAQMKTCIPEATAAMLKLFCAVESVRARSSQGGTSPDQVDGQLAYWNAQLGE